MLTPFMVFLTGYLCYVRCVLGGGASSILVAEVYSGSRLALVEDDGEAELVGLARSSVAATTAAAAGREEEGQGGDGRVNSATWEPLEQLSKGEVRRHAQYTPVALPFRLSTHLPDYLRLSDWATLFCLLVDLFLYGVPFSSNRLGILYKQFLLTNCVQLPCLTFSRFALNLLCWHQC